MSLTSTAFQVLTIVVAVVVTGALVLLWNQVRGPQLARLSQRVLLLVLGNGLTAVAVLVSVNIAYGGLIVSWSDLFSNPAGNGRSGQSSTGQYDGPGIADRLNASPQPGIAGQLPRTSGSASPAERSPTVSRPPAR
jgi:hypothetical protein